MEQPDGTKIKSVAIGRLKWKWLPSHLRTVHIFKDLKGSLLSVGLLCDAGFTVTFIKHVVQVTWKGTTVITGKRINRLWMIDMNEVGNESAMTNVGSVSTQPQTQYTAQMIVNTTHADIVKYAHLSMGAPTHPTFITAIKRGYISPPGLNTNMVRKNIVATVATAKGHLHLIKQGLQSTKIKPATEEKEQEKETKFSFPDKTAGEAKKIILTMKIFNTSDFQKLHGDIAGRFPYKSRRGHQYIAVFFSEEANYIHFELLQNRSAGEIVKAYKATVDFFEMCGINIQFLHMDGESSLELEKCIKKRGIKIQFAPPSNHRTLKAERSVQTAKNHIISTLCTTDPNFPMEQWDLLMTQIELTLNLMRGSAINPSISAWHQVHGPFKWNDTPIAPAGTKVVIHERTTDRKSWDPHGKDGFYVGPKMDHYRCFDIYVPETGATRTSDTIAWYPQQCVMPGGSVLELFTEATRDLTTTIKNLANSPPGTAHNRSAINTLADTLANALRKYHNMFHKTASYEQMEKKNTYSPDRHTIQRVPAVAVTTTDATTNDQTSLEGHTPQRVPATITATTEQTSPGEPPPPKGREPQQTGRQQ